MSTIKFSGNSSAFYSDLKHRVNNYFQEKRISTHGDYRSLVKVIVLMTLFLGIYPVLAFHILPGAWSLLACIVLGLVTASNSALTSCTMELTAACQKNHW